MTQRISSEIADPRWSCFRKKAYSDERLAEKVAARVSRESGHRIVHYACTSCGSWHIGHEGA